MDDEKLKDIKEDSKLMDQVGEISVIIHRSGVAIISPNLSTSSGKDRSTAAAKVHEKALKGQAKSHTTALGEGSLVPRVHARSNNLDSDDYPQAIYRFKYRSRDALKSLLIIKRTPSPEPEVISDSPSPSAAPTAGAGPALIKKHNGGSQGSNANGGPSVKRERVESGFGSSRKKVKTEKVVTIDLTEDSDDEDIVPLN